MKTLFSRLRGLVGNGVKVPRTPLIICGSGYEHYRLLALVTHSQQYEALALVDDFPWNHGTFVEGVRVYYPSETTSLVERHGVAALLYCQDSDLTLFDTAITAALAGLKAPFLKIDAHAVDDIDAELNRQLAS